MDADAVPKNREPKSVKRRVIFALVAAAGVAFVVVGIIKGDPETIHRFAAQI